MTALDLVRIEAGLHDWAAIECGCSWGPNRYSAEHIPLELIRLLEGDPEELGTGWVENHARIQSNLMDPAVATASLALAALAGRPPVGVRQDLLYILGVLSAGEQEDIAGACLDVARQGVWLYYEELAAFETVGASAEAYELLAGMDEQAERLAAYHRVYRDRLPHDLR
ncbi:MULTISPECIES: hypothetical protein [Streptomyces]|uniref:hypothetical protein n=1 Tax=Streptomyces TaxID=1883 RepID=UPI00136DFDE6|nr:hypothetical protein [Streptomyces sp. SID1046]MYV72416.1 hypothetical protein [Streptomyces sp. SID1046]